MRKLYFRLLSVDDIIREEDDLRSLFALAPEIFLPYYTIDRIINLLITQSFEAWSCSDGVEMLGVALTQTTQYESMKIMRLTHVVGKDAKEVLPRFLPDLEIIAKGNGVSRIEIEGRLGWLRLTAPQGFSVDHIILKKEL